MTDWNDPNADPLADLRTFTGLVSGDIRAPLVFAPHSSLYFGNWTISEPYEPEGDWLIPPTCRCDMNLCECNTPDPGMSFEEYIGYGVHWTMTRMGMTAGAAKTALQPLIDAYAKIEQSFKSVARTLGAEYQDPNLSGFDRLMLEKRKGHGGPPPPPKPVPAMRSVHHPSAYNRAVRGPR